MNAPLNETPDPALTSWVVSANTGNTDFPIQNLPFCVFRRAGAEESALTPHALALGSQRRTVLASKPNKSSTRPSEWSTISSRLAGRA